MCDKPIIIYGHQIWESAANTHTNRIQKIQNKFFMHHLEQTIRYLHTIPLVLHSIGNIPTIKEYIQNSLINNNSHPNPLIRNTGNCKTTSIPLKIKTKLPKHAIMKYNNNQSEI